MHLQSRSGVDQFRLDSNQARRHELELRVEYCSVSR